MIVFDVPGKRLYSKRQNLFLMQYGFAARATELTERQSDEISR